MEEPVRIKLEPLSNETFAPYGQVLESKQPVFPEVEAGEGRVAMELLKADPASTMMVGDSPVDIESANRAGVISIGVSWSLKGEEYIRQFNPANIIHDMRDLLEMVGLKGSVR